MHVLFVLIVWGFILSIALYLFQLALTAALVVIALIFSGIAWCYGELRKAFR